MTTHAVVWDLGGTLLDTYPEVDRTLWQAAGDDRVTLAEVSLLTRRSIGGAIEELAARHHMNRDVLDRAYAELMEHWRTHPAPLMDGARDVLDAVHDAGGLNVVVTHRDRTSATALLEGHGVVVDDLVCPGDGFPRKPDPTMMRTVLNRNGVAPEDAIAVGDRAIDVEAARAAGVHPVLLATPGLPVPRVTGDEVTTLTTVRDLLAGVAHW